MRLVKLLWMSHTTSEVCSNELCVVGKECFNPKVYQIKMRAVALRKTLQHLRGAKAKGEGVVCCSVENKLQAVALSLRGVETEMSKYCKSQCKARSESNGKTNGF